MVASGGGDQQAGEAAGAPARQLLSPEESQALSAANRLRRLLTPMEHLGTGTQSLVLAAAALLLAVPTVLLLAPGLTA
ncbi:hypothetical protein D477_012955 [Arthrobacter crystallopoietes BAB-32]|uniref:Uncharacterized protein n=1 Tax=Arthrobacter crystallopoietes BAB-32 TaxID=1246476 RepID=N1V6F6_9MICC|nr:hypothetical protein D477_012955 [Arthrobacter crystallopoietes BAB-32]